MGPRVWDLSTHVKSVCRSSKRTATAAAAYRAGDVIACEMEGIVHDYTVKAARVEGAEITLPHRAPDWATDRAKLWNAAEMRERNGKRGPNAGAFKANAQTAREFFFAFPFGLSAEGRLSVARIVARYLADTYGIAVDFALHLPGKDGDARNYHCHMLTSTRELTPDGFGKKVREWTGFREGSDNMKVLRAFIAKVENDQLAVEGMAGLVHVEHRSFKERGSGQVPTRHQGHVKTGKLRKNQQRARTAWQGQQRHAQNDTHAKDRAGLKFRQDFALQAKMTHLADREKAGIAAIRADLAKAQAADTAPKGASRLFQAVTGQAMRADFDRQARHAERAAAAEQAIAALKREVQAERNAYVTGQHRDRDALKERHGRDEQQFKQAVTARHDFDRAAEVQARREEVQGLERERPGRGRGPGDEFSP